MAITFKMVAKKNNFVTPPEIKYYPCAVHQGEVNLNDLAHTISSRSSMSKADCYGVLIALNEAIGESLSEGKIVKIEALGTFSISLSGTGAVDGNALGKDTIKSSKILFRPSKTLKKYLNKFSFKRIY